MEREPRARSIVLREGGLAAVQALLAVAGPKAAALVPVARFAAKLGPSGIRFVRSRRFRRFVALLLASPDADVAELRLGLRFDLDAETVRREFLRMLEDLESAGSDEIVEPMVVVFGMYTHAGTYSERAEVLALARLLRELRKGDVAELRQLVRDGLQHSQDEPVKFWNGATIVKGDEPAVVVGSGSTGMRITRTPHASRLFRLVKQADLATEVGATLDGYGMELAFLPSGEQTLMISRQNLAVLERVLR